MSKLLLNLRNVPDDEDVRAIQHRAVTALALARLMLKVPLR